MKNKMLLIFALILLMAIPSILAADTYKQGTIVDLTTICINNGTYCSGVAKCNITIFYPDGTILINNALMTNNDNYHNYTLTANQTSILGIYTTSMVCTEGDYKGYTSAIYEITSSGIKNISNLENPLLIFLIIIAFVILIFARQMENLYLSFISGAMFGLIGVYIIIYGLNNVVNMYTQGLGIVFVGLALYFIIVSAYELVENYGETGEVVEGTIEE